jgi:hypothetical protein
MMVHSESVMNYERDMLFDLQIPLFVKAPPSELQHV